MLINIDLIFVIFAHLSLCYGRFQVTKCCQENEHVGRNLSCEPNGNATYETVNWPWWFPNERKIVSLDKKDVRQEIDGFPDDAVLTRGRGAPCPSSHTSFLFSFHINYTFFTDGSIEILKNEYQNQDTIYPSQSYCIDRFVDIGFETSVDYVLQLCPCGTTVCLLKCCETGFILQIPHSKVIHCIENATENSWRPEMENYFILTRFPKCSQDEELVITDISVSSSTRMYDNASVWLDGDDGDAWVNPLHYCAENTIYHNNNTTTAATTILRCVPTTDVNANHHTKVKRILYASLSSIGAIFLFLTLVTYALLPRELSVNDKNLIAQTWSLLIGYLGLAISQFTVHYMPHWLCITFGFIILYSFLASFFWLNVLCIDLAWAFSELRLIRSLMVWQNRRRYLQYSLYAWLSPAIIAIVTILVDFAPNVPSSIIKPEFSKICWFRNDSLAKLAYFYGPIAVLLLSNIILFLYTALKIRAAQKQASTLLQNNAAQEKKRIVLYVKLFCLMGLSWIFELVSWIVGGPEYYWYGTDMVNLFRAVFIFITLCCKREVFEELKVKFKMVDRQGRQTASPSVVTLTSQYQNDRRSSQSPPTSSL